jgi:cytochrome c-type biogenesis protein CcmE
MEKRNNNRVFIVLATFFIVIGIFSVGIFTSKSASLVVTPSELVNKNSDILRIRVAGRVATERIKYQTDPTFRLEFFIEDREDSSNIKVPVIFEDVKPDMFGPKRDVLIDGDYIDKTIVASSLLTQCPSKYEPPIPEKK